MCEGSIIVLLVAGICVIAGRNDITVCFQCGGALKDWKDTDDPWSEHAVWFPTCLYVNHIKGTSFRGLKFAHGFQVCTDVISYTKNT
jgi:hypothetical protein